MWPFRKSDTALETATPAPVEQKALGDDPDVFDLLTGGSLSSFSVSASTALTVPAVQAAVRVISEAAATLDVTVKRRVGSEEVDAPDHPVSKLLRGQVNPWTSGFELIRDLVAEALTRDAGGFAWINRVNGRIAEVIKYESGSISVQYSTKGTQEPEYRLNGKRLRTSDVIHLRGTLSRCPLTLACDAIGAAKEMERHAGSFFKQGARPGGIIESPKPLGDEGVKKMIKAWRAAHDGSSNSGKTGILWDGAQFKPMLMNSTDAQFLELRKFQILEIARAFRVPPQMLFELDRATWSNSEQMAREFITYSLLPWLRALEAAFNRSLLSDGEQGEYRVAFDIDDTTQADLTARATAISTLITTETLSSNEARSWLGLPPRKGGDVYRNPAINPTPANTNTPPAKEAA